MSVGLGPPGRGAAFGQASQKQRQQLFGRGVPSVSGRPAPVGRAEEGQAAGVWALKPLHCPSCACRERWCHMTQEERDDSLRFNENITFGQLGTFAHNMLAFGLNKKLCNDFLKKQAVIGSLDEEQYKLLSDHIEQVAAE
eukprot:XP_028339725.1 uncharacterized protein KIAA0513-like [Physeter catodon]